MSIASKQSGKDTPLLRVPKDVRLDYKTFMRVQMELPETDTRWQGMCESLQRQGHGKPARFASAYAHQVATPLSERMDPREAPVTSFVLIDDPNDSNRWGHVAGKWGMGDGTLNGIPVVTNDVSDNEAGYDAGNVTVCPLGWFAENWGDSVQFATTWFGGDDIPTYVPETGKDDTEEFVKASIEAAKVVIEYMHKALRDNNQKEHPAHERALQREIVDQKKIIESLRELLPS